MFFQVEYELTVNEPGQYVIEVSSLPSPGDEYQGSTQTFHTMSFEQNYGKLLLFPNEYHAL